MINPSLNDKKQVIQPPFKKTNIPPKSDLYTLKMNDTTVHLHFNGNCSMTTRIANAFNMMIN